MCGPALACYCRICLTGCLSGSVRLRGGHVGACPASNSNVSIGVLMYDVCACSDRHDDAAQSAQTIKLPGYTGASGLPSGEEVPLGCLPPSLVYLATCRRLLCNPQHSAVCTVA